MTLDQHDALYYITELYITQNRKMLFGNLEHHVIMPPL